MVAKVLKGAEENQVDVNVFRISIVATFGCIDGTQSTFEEELTRRMHYPHAVWVKWLMQRRNNHHALKCSVDRGE
jgi:hypothetical protein